MGNGTVHERRRSANCDLYEFKNACNIAAMHGLLCFYEADGDEGRHRVEMSWRVLWFTRFDAPEL